MALRFAEAMFSGQTDSARDLVAPSSQSAFRLVLAGVDPRTLSSRGLAVGSATVDGVRATVILTGSICHSQSPTAPTTADDCLSNSDPHSDNPIFRVDVGQQPDKTWLVVLGQAMDVPSADPSSNPTTQTVGPS